MSGNAFCPESVQVSITARSQTRRGPGIQLPRQTVSIQSKCSGDRHMLSLPTSITEVLRMTPIPEAMVVTMLQPWVTPVRESLTPAVLHAHLAGG